MAPDSQTSLQLWQYTSFFAKHWWVISRSKGQGLYRCLPWDNRWKNSGWLQTSWHATQKVHSPFSKSTVGNPSLSCVIIFGSQASTHWLHWVQFSVNIASLITQGNLRAFAVLTSPLNKRRRDGFASFSKLLRCHYHVVGGPKKIWLIQIMKPRPPTRITDRIGAKNTVRNINVFRSYICCLPSSEPVILRSTCV